MTLARQIILVISLVFLLVLAGVFVHGVLNTRAYLSQQLGSHAQDTATSLALSLGPVLQQQDMAAAESLVDAIADRGYYQRIEYLDLANASRLKREFPVVVEGVPPWFTLWVKLETPEREALIMAGWQQHGRLQVVSHAGYAYRELWESSIATAAWLGGGWLLTVGSLMLLLRWVLAPLLAVERQAEAIGKGQFLRLELMPRTRELRRVVKAMNSMAAQVERIIGEKIAALARVEQASIIDAVTGLPNRQHMEARLTELLRAPQRAEGLFAVISLSDLEAYNNAHGYQAGNKALQAVAQSLRVFCNIEFGESTLTRFAGAEFALLASGVGGDEIPGVMERLLAALPAQPASLHIGVTDLGHADRSALLGAADLATRAAQAKAQRAWHRSAPSAAGDLPQGAQAWRATIQQALQQGQLKLHGAAVVDSRSGQLVHQELLAQLVLPGKAPILAGAFMPMVERLRLAPVVDCALVQQALQLLEAADGSARYAVNLSPQSLHDPVFTEWLAQRLQQQGARAQRITLEIPAIVLHQADLLRAFMQRLETTGVAFAIDRVSAPVPQPTAWPGLALAYIKLDAAYVMSLEGEVNILVHLDALRDFARGLGLTLIATGIANPALRALAIKVGVDGLQGAAIDAQQAES
jgi:diguanylate cyclase (GGDEF)-like protein